MSQENCERCEYDLRGGPPRGSCPECGLYYDRVTGKGVSRGQRVDLDKANAIVFWVGIGFAMMLAGAVMLIAVLAASVSRSPETALWVGGSIAGLITLTCGGLVLLHLLDWVARRRELRDRAQQERRALRINPR